ncbi:MAG: 5-formyltetrahydrofolate cyclo-ligase, partial [Nocardioidaceae bacterium]
QVDTVAAYVSMADEPPTTMLLDRLHRRGLTVLLPVLLADLDLDWAVHRLGDLRSGRLGLLEPAGERRGFDAIGLAQLICCPGLAGSAEGLRLGRGGGSYDRALGRARPAAVRCLLVYDDEVLADIPVEPHDQRVDALVTPTRTLVAPLERAGLSPQG